MFSGIAVDQVHFLDPGSEKVSNDRYQKPTRSKFNMDIFEWISTTEHRTHTPGLLQCF